MVMKVIGSVLRSIRSLLGLAFIAWCVYAAVFLPRQYEQGMAQYTNADKNADKEEARYAPAKYDDTTEEDER